jgi:hypothetical protein
VLLPVFQRQRPDPGERSPQPMIRSDRSPRAHVQRLRPIEFEPLVALKRASHASPERGLTKRARGAPPKLLRKGGSFPALVEPIRDSLPLGQLDAQEPANARQRKSRRRMLSNWTTQDGAFMEPRGCNRWQSLANRIGAPAARTSQNRCHGLRSVAKTSAW